MKWIVEVAKRVTNLDIKKPGVIAGGAAALACFVVVSDAWWDWPLSGKGQLLATVIGLTVAAWFTARRLLLLEKAAEYQPMKDAIELAGRDEVAGQLAGVRRLHLVGQTNPECREIVRDILCGHIASEKAPESKQLALRLLFGAEGIELYGKSTDPAWLDGADLRGASLDGLCLDDAVLRSARLGDVSNVNLKEADLQETTWGAQATGSALDGASLRGVRLSGTRFENVHFKDSDMSSGEKETAFIGCRFYGCDFSGANWDGTDFSGSRFDKHCTGIDFDRCKVANVEGASGIPPDVRDRLRQSGLGGFQRPTDEADGENGE